jgi:hypothetical protein
MLTKKEFDEIPSENIFATGVLPNSPLGIFMNSTGGNLKWVAKKGLENDWTIYYQISNMSAEWIGKHGRKVYHDKIIKKCVPCDADVFILYKF